jgi:hypothetical protein
MVTQMPANAWPEPTKVLSLLDELEQVSIANMEIQPIGDAAAGRIAARVFRRSRCAVEAAVARQRLRVPKQS